MADPKDIIIGEISNTLSKLVGQSAGAVLRRAGSQASHRLWPELPSDQTIDQAGEIMRQGVEGLGGFGAFELSDDGEGGARIQFRDCFFATMTDDPAKKCGRQPICFFGFGLVEETLMRLTGIRTRVEIVRHDVETSTCHEVARPR